MKFGSLQGRVACILRMGDVKCSQRTDYGRLCFPKFLPQYISSYMFFTQCRIDTAFIEYWSLFPVPWWTFGVASIECGRRVAMWLLRLNQKNFMHPWMVLSECLLLKVAILPVQPGRGPWRGNRPAGLAHSQHPAWTNQPCEWVEVEAELPVPSQAAPAVTPYCCNEPSPLSHD